MWQKSLPGKAVYEKETIFKQLEFSYSSNNMHLKPLAVDKDLQTKQKILGWLFLATFLLFF